VGKISSGLRSDQMSFMVLEWPEGAVFESGTPKWEACRIVQRKRPDRMEAGPNQPAATWKVGDGKLVSPGHGPELISDSQFGDFKLHIEFNCRRTQQRVYLRGRYESSGGQLTPRTPKSPYGWGLRFPDSVAEMPRKAVSGRALISPWWDERSPLCRMAKP